MRSINPVQERCLPTGRSVAPPSLLKSQSVVTCGTFRAQGDRENELASRQEEHSEYAQLHLEVPGK